MGLASEMVENIVGYQHFFFQFTTLISKALELRLGR